MKNFTKKILIAHSSNDNYGASKVLVSIINVFINNGFKIYLLLPCDGPLNNNSILKKTEITIINLGVFRKKYFNIFGLINRLYFIIKSSFFIKKFLKNNQIDLVYTNTSTIISPSIAAKFTGIPSIYHIHEIPNSNLIYAKFITTFLNNFARDISCVSKSTIEFWINVGLKKSKVKLIYNGFNFKNIKPKIVSDQRIIFTSISRIIPYKGHIILIRIFDVLCKKNDNIHLQIIGDTLPQYQEYLDKLKWEVKKRNLGNKIKFLAFRKDVKSILENSSFFIHTPKSADPLPTVIFEAIESKTPVITNNLGGAFEILNNGKNGLMIKNDLINESAEKILKYIENHELQTENVERAYDYVCKNFSVENFEKKITQIIE